MAVLFVVQECLIYLMHKMCLLCVFMNSTRRDLLHKLVNYGCLVLNHASAKFRRTHADIAVGWQKFVCENITLTNHFGLPH